jgi:hypothetical protein
MRDIPASSTYEPGFFAARPIVFGFNIMYQKPGFQVKPLTYKSANAG